MKIKNYLFLFFALQFFFHLTALSQSRNDGSIKPHFIGTGVFLGETPPLKDIPPATPEELEFLKQKAIKKAAAKVYKPRLYPFAATALPVDEDPVWQKSVSKSTSAKAPLVNFDGQTTASSPPDCNGTIGPNHYMQTINVTYAIYNRSGTLLAGPTNMNQLFNGVSGSSCNDGDPLVQYDEISQRWVAVEFSLCGANDLMLMAVSATSDPTGTWYAYSFDVADTPDYEKLGIWQDGYYMGTNTGSGNDIYVFEKSVMMAGGSNPKMVAFDNPWRPGTGFLCVPPLDNDGTHAPSGTPGLFIAFNDDAVAGGTDQLWLYELDVDWTTTANSTFNRVQQIDVAAFDSRFNSLWNDITQPNSQKLDAVPQVIMNAPQYRNFGTYQTIVCCHSVDVDNTDHAGIRWYELRKTPPSNTWVLRQQGTFAPDVHSRWMGSIMLNGSGKIGLAYSISSSTIYPGIRYCGQSTAAYNNATGVLDVPEEIIHNGTLAQTGNNRWGDYALLSVDPNDDETFWFTSEYIKTGGTTKGTKIASFRIGNAPITVTNAATAVTGTSVTLNGTVNPNGLATNYYFEWGISTSYGNSTTLTSAGSGTVNVAVSANLTGLSNNTTYYYRIVAVNSDGTSYGSNLSFITGGVMLSTTAVTAVTTSSASSGGNITSDGGFAVTARGVCWSTSMNPTLVNNFTVDGSGTGSFTSNLTGLNSNTTYYVRAYATNANGTFYGDNISFKTLCGKITSFPWNEGFENAGTIPSCWSQEYVSTPGLNWTFVTGNGGSQPATAHGGTYNACLKDNSSADNKTKLVTPSLDLTGISSPTLTFWHTQALWSPDQDQLIVYYKTSSAGTWTSLATYTTSVTSWTQRTITLPNQSGDYYIAFEGNAKYGYGVCVDDVVVSGGCSLPGNAGTISGLTTVCQGQSSVVYTVPTISGATNYIWTLPSGASGSSSTNSITVSYGISAVSGNITVKGNNTCGDGNLSSLAITVNPLPSAAGSITGPQNICPGISSVIYSINPISNATTYQWTLPPGATGTSTSNSITVDYSLSASNGNITVKGINSCGEGTSSSIAISIVSNPTASITPSGPINICSPSTQLLTAITSAVNPTYQWKLNGSNISGANSSTYSAAGSGVYSVEITDGGLCAALSNLVTITLNLSPATVSVTGGGTFCGNTLLTADNGSDGIIYFQNTISNGTSTLYPQASQTVNASGTYYFRAQSLAGCWSQEGSAEVIIKPLPVITSFTSTPSSLCLGNSSTLSVEATGDLNNFTTSAASGTISVAITDASTTGVSYSLPITNGSGNIGTTNNIQVTLSISHNNDADLDIFLVGPGNCGTMLLSTDNGGTGNNYTNTVLSTSASNIIGTTGYNTAPFTGTYRPEGTITTAPVLTGGYNSGTYSLPSASLNGCPVNGNWTLFVADDRSTTIGTLTKFEIVITGSGGNFTHQFSGNGNIGAVNYSGSNNQNGTSTVTGIPAGSNSYNVITTGPNGCTATSSLNLNVNTPSTAAVTVHTSSTDICVGTGVILTQSGGSLGTNAYWQWYSDASYTVPVGQPVTTANAELLLTPTATTTYYVRAEGTASPCQTTLGDNTKFVTVTVNEMPNSGVLTKLPDAAVVCGTSVSAVLIPGTGGAGTINDVLEYSYDGLVWNPYISGAAISTTGYPSVQIRTYRTSSVDGCNSSTPNVVSWLIAEPYNLSATNIYNNSADLTWSDDNGSQWNIQYGLQGFSLGSGTMVSGLTVKNNHLSGLSPATAYSFYVQTDCDGQNTAWAGPFNFTTDNSQLKTLNVKLYLEGLYNENGLMNQARNDAGPQFGTGIADKIKIELHNENSYNIIVYEVSDIELSTSGNAVVVIPGVFTGSYYITVKHRNSIETLSAFPISFSNSVISYDFTNSAGKAYGSNQKAVSGGYFAIFTGDINQDGNVDGSDIAGADNAVTNLLEGYISEDVDGTGMVDGSDVSIIDNNSSNIVGRKLP